LTDSTKTPSSIDFAIYNAAHEAAPRFATSIEVEISSGRLKPESIKSWI
jgi:hypothetical protein